MTEEDESELKHRPRPPTDRLTGNKKYIHVICMPNGPSEIPGHAALMVSDKPYIFTQESEFWEWPTKEGLGMPRTYPPLAFYDKQHIHKSAHDSIVCLGAISSHDYATHKANANSLVGASCKNFWGYPYPNGITYPTFAGKTFGVSNNCFHVAKKILTQLCPELADPLLRQSGLITPSQFVAAAYAYAQKKYAQDASMALPADGFFPLSRPAEVDDSYKIRWRTAAVLHDDKLLRRRNLLVTVCLLTLIPTPILTRHFLGDKMPAIPIPKLPNNTETWAETSTLITLLVIAILLAATRYQRKHGPYQGEPRFKSSQPLAQPLGQG